MIRPFVSPFSQGSLDEPLGLSVSLRSKGFGAFVRDGEQTKRLGIAVGAEAGAVIGHDAPDPDAVTAEEAQCIEQEADAGFSFLVRQDFAIGQAGMVIHSQMQVFPSLASDRKSVV